MPIETYTSVVAEIFAGSSAYGPLTLSLMAGRIPSREQMAAWALEENKPAGEIRPNGGCTTPRGCAPYTLGPV